MKRLRPSKTNEDEDIIMTFDPSTNTTTFSPQREPQKDSPLVINVGGTLFTTSLKTLTEAFPQSLVARRFARLDSMPCDDEGRPFMDEDPELFAHILHVLRRPTHLKLPPKDINHTIWEDELDYWCLLPNTVIIEKRQEYQRERTKCLTEYEEEDRVLVALLLKVVDLTALFYCDRDDNADETRLYYSQFIVEGTEKIGETELVSYILAHENHIINLLSDITPYHEIEVSEATAYQKLSQEERDELSALHKEISIQPDARAIQLIFTLRSEGSKTFLTL